MITSIQAKQIKLQSITTKMFLYCPRVENSHASFVGSVDDAPTDESSGKV
jgi:hypothetical protein